MKTTFNNKLAALLFGVLFISSSAFSQNNAGNATGAAADKSFKPNATSTNSTGNNATSVSTTPEMKPNPSAQPGVNVYATPDANYGFFISKNGKTIFQQEQIEAAAGKPVIYFSKADAEKAGAFVLRQINEGATPAQITYSSWQQIQKTSSK